MHSSKRENNNPTLPENPTSTNPVLTFQCKKCSTILPNHKSYVEHLRLVHGDQSSVCGDCGKIFKLRGSLLVHQRVVHNPQGGNYFYCSICNRKFSNKYRRNIHERQHSKE